SGPYAALRRWRLKTAKQRKVPAFTVMHDKSLEELCRVQPTDLAALRRVHGFGERKTDMYGEEILAVLARFHLSKRQAAGSARPALR
ncbi:MAG: HRDC domain-containing protein, partial [Bryobacteraceae bacterium]